MIGRIAAFVFSGSLVACTAAAGAIIATSISASPGTAVPLRLNSALSSSDSHAGDRVEFRVAQDISIGGAIAITKNSLAWGSVAEAAPRGRMAHSGRLSVNIRGVCLADGRQATLRGTNPNSAAVVHPRHPSESESAFAVPAWPILVFMLGKDVNIPAGTAVTAYLDAPVQVDPSRLAATPMTSCDDGVGKNMSSLKDGAYASIRSNPDGAEITIDGRFAGNTPSRIRLTAGEHRIAVGFSGADAWERKVTVTAGDDLTIVAMPQPAQAIAGSRAVGN